MHTQRQSLVEAIFLEAIELPEDTRDAFLASRCGDDLELRREVESLLGAHQNTGGMLDEPQPLTMGLMQQLSGLLRADDASIPPSGKIGGYRVIRVLGSGGMGVVYLAEQERPKRTVALKVIRRGLATPSLLRRFEHEAEILGRLHHPGIAQIFEAGVAHDGLGPQPYIAMEYIDGRPLTEHASIYRLSLRDKLILMARVCEAVQHAHQRGVIHRDLKPGNIFVEPEEAKAGRLPDPATKDAGSDTSLGLAGVGVGQPKILDFGVARIADDRAGLGVTTMGTNVGQLIGTLAYMSPEQFGHEASEVDTRSDVYALGVVLFQLLTGKLPYDVSGLPLPEAVRRIKDEEPLRLSAVDRELRGDLETIVSKAIEKDKARRYQSAAELGGDLRRYLLGEPILAKRDSALYVLHKQMLRYKTAVGAAAVGVMTLAAFAVYAAMSAEKFKAVAAREKLASETAIQERARADATARKLQQELFVSSIERGRLEGATGKVVVAEELLWGEYFRDPESPHSRWALWELYERYPCRWTIQAARRTRCLAVNPAGTIAAVGSDEKMITFYEVEKGDVVGRITDLKAIPVQLDYDPAGERLVVGLNNGAACVVRVDGSEAPVYLGEPDGQAHSGYARAAAWSPDGKYIATGGADNRIHLWDPVTLKRTAGWEAHTRAITSVAFNPDATILASGSYESGPDARIRLWSVPDGAPIGELTARESVVGGLAFSPDGTKLASAAHDRFTLMHNLAAKTSRVIPSTFSGGGAGVAFSPDGKWLMGCGGGESRIWNSETLAEFIVLAQHRLNVIGARWISPNRAISVSFDGAIKCWDTRRAIPMRGSGIFKTWCFGTAYSPDGARYAIASGDGTIAINDSETRKRLHLITVGENLRTRPVRFLADNRTLLAGSADGKVRVINAETGTITRSFGAAVAEIFALSLHPDGFTLASSHRDSCVRIWDLRTGELLRELKDPRIVERVEGAEFSPDGRLLACSGLSKGVLLWSTDDWRVVGVLDGAAQVWPVAFSQDGKILAAGTWSDTVELWEISTLLQVGVLKGHRGLVSTVAFSPDGQYIASGGDDATVKLWHLASRRCLLTIDTHHGEATGLSFHPSGNWLTTGCQDHAAPSWNLRAMDAHIEGNMPYQRARLEAAGSD